MNNMELNDLIYRISKKGGFFNYPVNRYVITLYNSVGIKIDENIISAPSDLLKEVLIDYYRQMFNGKYRSPKITLERKGDIRTPFGLFKTTIPKRYYILMVNDNKYIVHVTDLGRDRL